MNVEFKKIERRREEKILSRLLSIKHDSEFVEFCSKKFAQFPIIPNQRAGDWYVSPYLKTHGHSVYFKSTDGHFGEWNVSLKRLNLHILEVIAMHKGAVIVDITKKGKRFPDAFAKTVPIWLAVLNKIAGHFLDGKLKIPTSIVSSSECSQINELLDCFAEKIQHSVEDIDLLKKLLVKPLRPIWIHPSSRFIQDITDTPIWTTEELNELQFYPVVLVSASISKTQDLENEDLPHFAPPESFDYIQGASDDSELWCPGLCSSNFWNICDLLNENTQLNEIPELIEMAISRNMSVPHTEYSFIANSLIALGNVNSAKPPQCWTHFDYIVNCGAQKLNYETKYSNKVLFLPIEEGKRGQNQFYVLISKLLDKIEPEITKNSRILIHCDTGKDRGAAVLMAVFLEFYDLINNRLTKRKVNHSLPITKDVITKLLIKVQAGFPQALPSRALMKKLNLYFLTPQIGTNILNRHSPA